jgi:hypothetical protein
MIFLVCISGTLAYVLHDFQWPVGTRVSYYINANTSQVDDEDTAVNNAARSWSKIWPTGLTLFSNGPTAISTHGFDGVNAIFWTNEGDSGALATSWMWYSGNTMLETDMVFNDYYKWYTLGADYDIETVALHEFGHWVGLDHSPTGIMQPSYSGVQRHIDADAQEGFRVMYGHGRVTVAPAEFLPVNGAAEQLAGQPDWGGYVYRTDTSTTDEYCAQVDLPHGAKIKYVRLHFWDNESSANIECSLLRTNKYTGASDIVYQVETVGASASVQFATDYSPSPAPSYSLINVDACSYFILIHIGAPGPGLRIYGVTVEF